MPNTPHELRVGQIVWNSWGYDQTNVDFFRVVRVLPKSVAIVKMLNVVVSGHGEPSEQVMPIPGSADPYEKVLTRRVRVSYEGVPCVSINSFASAHLWGGNPCHQTGACYGH